MRLIALQPPPPRPTTLIVAACSGTKRFASAIVVETSREGKSGICLAVKAPSTPDRDEPRPHFRQHAGCEPRSARRRTFAPGAEENESDSGGVFGFFHRIGEPCERRRNPDPNRQAEELRGRDIDMPKMRAAAGYHDFAEH